MAGLCLFWILVGPTAALQVILPESSVYISAGNTALLSASLNFSPPVPNYFQLRWRFVTGSWLVLKLKANNCMAKNGTQHWRDSCVISIEATERYRQRAKLSSNDASLVLQDVRTEDSGIYSVTVLALDMTSSATISLAVTKVDPDIPVSFVKAADDGGYTLSNSIQLGLAGLILCLLGLIIAEHVSFTHCKCRKITAQNGRETKQYQAGIEPTVPPEPGSIYELMEKPPSSDELYCSISC
ncbi:uncharacterized protein LOC129328565 isoform X1 [Eublepharis macularius]|uniref:Uncharacterized protein LOC129328565 isoform X1 n=1 Tax=Eublepharis macularius TaxID=481883 RepID=A0AA97J9X1_EUBMA|nr:uncharacterized protein LOC129328565 isoform X1 [Eublepharis macularius]